MSFDLFAQSASSVENYEFYSILSSVASLSVLAFLWHLSGRFVEKEEEVVVEGRGGGHP